ncbi:hypothetical protein [Ramlibacter sp.]|uniref:hypothetical protein n=1 Tax=Ramlibacter sp. TaxID=1917967 RepID=UPI002636F9CA|nr:hypothetical protein [Ramlibacter sp.]MDB5957694.1 hypothetical protein [Ramlibacter sp.]
MTDITARHRSDQSIVQRFKDMGDSTWAAVIALGGNGYPSQSTPVHAASGSVAASATTATLPGAAGKTTYITGFEVTGAGATAASVIAITVTGLLGGTETYIMAIPAGAAVGATPLSVQFAVPVPASAVNTSVVVNVPSFGAGNTNAAVVAHGFQL